MPKTYKLTSQGPDENRYIVYGITVDDQLIDNLPYKEARLKVLAIIEDDDIYQEARITGEVYHQETGQKEKAKTNHG
jgi:hypothetical protein